MDPVIAEELAHRRRVRSWVSAAAAITSFVVAFATVFLFFQEPRVKTPRGVEFELLQETQSKLDQLDAKLLKVEADINALSNTPDTSKFGMQLNRLELSVKALQSNLSNLNQAILQSPLKAIEIPLLRKDLDTMEKKNQSDLLTIKDEMERVYDLTKWFLGLMLTMALGILGLAVSNFARGKEK